MKLDLVLQKFGLTRREALLYLATLELGSASVQKIAEKSALVRSTAYEVLERLRVKGLVTTYLKKKIRWYSAEDPRQVVNFAESRVDTLKEALPELEAIVGKSRRRPNVRFYEGVEGMMQIVYEALDEADTIAAFASADDTFATLSEFRASVKERVRRKIPIRILMKDSPVARERKRLGPSELRTVRLIPPTHNFHGLVYIWKNKIAQFSFKDTYVATVTESKELADMQRAWFEALWEKLPD